MKLSLLLLPIFLISLNIDAAVAADADSLGTGQETFFSQFRTAIYGEDVGQLMKLTHPLAMECTKNEEQQHYYEMVMKGLVMILGRQQTIKEIKSKKVEAQELKKETDTASQAGMRWPISPEEQLMVRYETEGTESTASIYIARDGDEWKWVHFCYK